MDTFVEALKDNTNLTLTENGATTRTTTKSALMDLFALGGAYRSRSDRDCISLFREAFNEDEVYALKCLFYLRDCRGGQGERRFFRTCLKWLANNHPETVLRNIVYIPTFGRYDDWFCLFDTKLEKEALLCIKTVLMLDITSKTPSLLGKWLPSINASSYETRRDGNKIREYLGMTHKQYRKTLSILRARINIVERLMSENRWDEIEFDKIPSKAGFTYRNAFARRDIIKEKYKTFAEDKTTKVNADVLYPYECVKAVFDKTTYYYPSGVNIEETERAMLNKYWDNMADYINNAEFNGLAVVDVSGSMYGRPLEVAISLGMYCAEKAKGPFTNHFLTFSEEPELVKIKGDDFVDKVYDILKAPWGMNTDIEAVFDLLLDTAINSGCAQEDIPQNLIIISDMEFDSARGCWREEDIAKGYSTLMESIAAKWDGAGYKMPNLVFWNVDARQDNIPMKAQDGVTFVSGFSPVLYEQIMKGVTAEELMYDKLNSERYECIK